MSNDFAIQPLSTMQSAVGAVGEVKPAAMLPSATAATAATAAPSTPARAANAAPITNPTLRLDPALGLVVLEFRNATGAITTSIPSERQLQAYQRWDTTRVGPAPVGRYNHAGSEPQPVDKRGAARGYEDA